MSQPGAPRVSEQQRADRRGIDRRGSDRRNADRRGTGRRQDDRRGTDQAVVRTYAVVRTVITAAISVTALFVPAREADTRLWLLLVAAAWLPVALVMLGVTWHTRNQFVLVIGPVADLVMVALAQALWHQGIGLAAAYPIIVAVAAYSCPRVPPLMLGGFTLAVALGIQSRLPVSQRFTPTEFGLFAALLIGVLLIVERAGSRSRGAEERVVRAETRADVILAAVASAVVVTDSTGRVVSRNPAADRLLVRGAGTAEADGNGIAGRPCTEALGLRVGERRLDCSAGCQLLALAADRDRDGAEQLPFDVEAWRPADDGGRQPLLVSVDTLPATDGPDVEVVHSIRDITRLKQADEAKTLFLATASHELRTPLTVINGFAKTLTTRALPPDKQRDALAAIRRRGEELARVVDRLLLSSRIEAGSTEVARQPVDLIPLIYERAAALGEAGDRVIDVDLPDDLPSALGDASAITTVVDHLLENAVKYSPGGEPVSVRARSVANGPADGQPGAIVIEIADSGVGMDPRTVRHCFDKFWQADTSGTRRFGGTGIGLYIVRSLTEAMGGTVAVTSTPDALDQENAGTTFTVQLPAADSGPLIPARPDRPEGPAVSRRVPA